MDITYKWARYEHLDSKTYPMLSGKYLVDTTDGITVDDWDDVEMLWQTIPGEDVRAWTDIPPRYKP